jgi:hypothetical protein
MNRAALVAEILNQGFDPGQDVAHARRWLDSAYGWVWNAAEWEFQRVGPVVMAVTTGDDTPALPADYGDSLRIFDNTGNYLEPLDPDIFDMIYMPGLIAATTGTPIAWKMENRIVYLGPTPSGNSNFRIAYKRRLAHFLADGSTVTAGPMVLDTSQPLWEASHHMVLVYAAAMIGRAIRGEAPDTGSSVALRQMRDDTITAMIADLGIPPIRGEFGRADRPPAMA